MPKKLLLSYLCWCCLLPAFSQPYGTYSIRWNEPVQPLYDHMLVHFDHDYKLGIEDMIAGKAAFVPFDDSVKIDWYGAWWMKVTLHAPFSFKDYIVGVRNMSLPGTMNGSGEVGVWLVKNGKVVQHYEAGNFRPRSGKAVKDPVNACAFPLSMDSLETIDLYLCEYESKMLVRSSMFYLLHPDIPLVNPGNPNLAISLFFFGVMFIMFFFGLVFFFITRNPPFGWFALCALSHGLHTLLGTPDNLFVKWFIPEYPYPQLYLMFTFISTNLIFFVQFGRTFAGIASLNRIMDRALLGLLVYCMVFIVIYWVDFMAAWEVFRSWKRLVYVTIPVMAVTGVWLLFVKRFTTRCLGIAMLWLVAFQTMGSILSVNMALLRMGLNPWMIAPIGYMIVIFFGLAYNFRKAEKEKAGADKIREMDSIKSRFFANISHEFRTPLTLIQGPLKQMEALADADHKQGNATVPVPARQVRTMRRNTDRLLELVNQLLDLSKLDSGHMRLHVQKGELVQTIKVIAYAFESMAERKQIHYHTHFPETQELVYFDKDKVEKILGNLLGNAFKYTPERGTVSLHAALDDQRLRITVEDSGPGIPKKELDKIFDRFYQVEGNDEKGSGIGLALVKELTELYRGQISVSSETGKGSSFKISLPVDRQAFRDDEVYHSVQTEAREYAPSSIYDDDAAATAAPPASADDMPIVLVAEDNAELRRYIRENLEDKYQVVEAENGKTGLRLATEYIPDLIISDVMMPEMDGLTLASRLRKDERCSHIPVILLTAKAGQQQKIEGLESGADDYLTKPFDPQELLVRVDNLIRQRRLLRRKFAGTITLKASEVSTDSLDDRFLRKVMEAIEAGLADEAFGVEEMAKAVAMSRSQLHRKLAALTGQAPSDLLRRTRLQRAFDLLRRKAGLPSEVAWQVGFGSHAYFSKCFKEEFGISPGEVGRDAG